MGVAVNRGTARRALRLCLVAALATAALPARAQNKRGAWEVFLYFGGYFANDVPAARQAGDIIMTRVAPEFAVDPNSLAAVHFPNLGNVGGNQDPSDKTYPFTVATGTQFSEPPCSNMFALPTDPNDPRIPYFDECDADQESRWRYNAGSDPINTNGEIQRDDSEFQLGIRAGYNFTRHWEVELDLGFGKQRLDLTKNLDPLLSASIFDIADPRASRLAEFYQFTWANADYASLMPDPNSAPQEHPSVISSRRAADPNYDLPLYFPVIPPPTGPRPPNPGETFEDVTDFINRVFNDPTAFRNRGNQINIDQFTISVSGKYNFNTKADSRIVPYVGAGLGRWIRNFDAPWDGNDTSFAIGEAGVRLFINEIFAFRFEGRYVSYLDDFFTIRGELRNFNIPDRQWEPFGTLYCARDNRERRPPCTTPLVPIDHAFPNLNGGGGNASVTVEAELDDFYELRVGFDVVLGGK